MPGFGHSGKLSGCVRRETRLHPRGSTACLVQPHRLQPRLAQQAVPFSYPSGRGPTGWRGPGPGLRLPRARCRGWSRPSRKTRGRIRQSRRRKHLTRREPARPCRPSGFGGHAHPVDFPSQAARPGGRGHLDAAPVGEGVDSLNRALAVGLLSKEAGNPPFLERPGQDLRRAGAVAVDENRRSRRRREPDW